MTTDQLPYSSAKAGQAREAEIRKTLRGIGAGAIGFMIDDDNDLIIAQFRLHGRNITIPIKVAEYEKEWRRHNRPGPRTRKGDYDIRAKKAAEAAAWAILVDWIKAQATMISVGFFSADDIFLPYIHSADGRPVRVVLNSENSPLMLPAKEQDDD